MKSTPLHPMAAHALAAAHTLAGACAASRALTRVLRLACVACIALPFLGSAAGGAAEGAAEVVAKEAARSRAHVTVAVAANFSAPMQAIARDFERTSGHKLTLAPGATGQLYAQIRNGAPFDVLLSADNATPARLEKEGLAVAGTRFTYAVGRLVLWSKRPGFVDAQGQVLRSGTFERIAIANPKLAPYGAAAIETLAAMGVRERTLPKLVEGANITQAYQFVASENAQLGLLAMSQVFENGQLKEGSAWVVPTFLHEPILQDAVLLRPGSHKPGAAALLRYLQSEPAKALIRTFGYGP